MYSRGYFGRYFGIPEGVESKLNPRPSHWPDDMVQTAGRWHAVASEGGLFFLFFFFTDQHAEYQAGS